MTTCDYCKPHKTQGILSINIEIEVDDECEDRNIEVYMNADRKQLTLESLDVDIYEDEIEINYCPFCGRKLND